MKIQWLSAITSKRLYPLIVGISILLLIIIDLGSKHFFYNQDGGSFSWIQPAFNEGISYSISVNLILVILLSLISLGWLTRLYRKHHIGSWIYILIMAGGGGNLIDRVVYGGVRDFIYLGDRVPFVNFIFNIADVFLILGVILLIYQYNQVDITSNKRETKTQIV